MDEDIRLCPGCMRETPEGANTCPVCGFDLDRTQDSQYLAYNTIIGDRYVVGDILEQGADGVTYLGKDTVTGEIVRIREFFPAGLCERGEDLISVQAAAGASGEYRRLLGRFTSLWNGVMSARAQSAVMNVYDVIESGGTVYAVTEADGSVTLSDYLDEKGALSWEKALDLLVPVMDGVEALNAMGIIHGGLSPETLFIGDAGNIKIWGYQVEDSRIPDGSLRQEIIPGYAAPEQYDERLSRGTHTDVYAIGALMYRCITGSDPLDSEERMKEDALTLPAEYAGSLPDYAVKALVASMGLMPSERLRTVTDVKGAFDPATFSVKSDFPEMTELDDEEEAPALIPAEDTVPVLSKRGPVGTVEGVAPSSVVLMSLCIVFVMLIFFAGLTFAGVVSFNLTGAGKTAAVFDMPDFTNLDKSDPQISKIADKYNLHITLQPDYAQGAAENMIFEQDIAPGTQVAIGSSLTLKYSRGATIVSLPNFTGISMTEAVYYMGKLNVTYNIVEKVNDGSGKAGYIASMSPSAGSSVYEGSEVTLEVWGASAAEGGAGMTSSTDILDSLVGQFRNLLG